MSAKPQLLRRIGHSVYQFLNTNLGIFILGGIVLGGLGYLYGERSQCITMRDADYLGDNQNKVELHYMYQTFLINVGGATNVKAFKEALKELGPNRDNYIFSHNKDKTAAEIVWEHFIVVHRWDTHSTGEFSAKTNQIDALIRDLKEYLSTDNPQTQQILSLAKRARKLYNPQSKPDELWSTLELGGCGPLSLIAGSFREIKTKPY